MGCIPPWKYHKIEIHYQPLWDFNDAGDLTRYKITVIAIMTTARETEEKIEFGVWVPGLSNYMVLEKSLILLSLILFIYTVGLKKKSWLEDAATEIIRCVLCKLQWTVQVFTLCRGEPWGHFLKTSVTPFPSPLTLLHCVEMALAHHTPLPLSQLIGRCLTQGGANTVPTVGYG